MIGAVLLVIGYAVVIASICGIVAAFFAHGFLWSLLPETVTGVIGAAFCAALVFVMMWSMNPDPDPRNDGRPTLGGTVTLTGFSGLFWIPLYFYAFTAIRRRRRASGDERA